MFTTITNGFTFADLVQPLTEHFDEEIKFSCSVVYLFLHFQHTLDYVLEMFIYSFWHEKKIILVVDISGGTQLLTSGPLDGSRGLSPKSPCVTDGKTPAV